MVSSYETRLLLRADIVHRLLHLTSGSLLQCVAEATGIPDRDLVCAVQLHPFARLCFQGQLVSGCISYCQCEDHGEQEFLVLFLNPRELGCAVCSREVTRLIFTADELLRLVDGVVPLAHRLVVEGGRPSLHRPGCLYFENFGSVVLWAEPETSAHALCSDSGSSHDGADESAGRASSSSRSRSPRCRSRSPRCRGLLLPRELLMGLQPFPGTGVGQLPCSVCSSGWGSSLHCPEKVPAVP